MAEAYAHYRKSTLGVTLVDSLDEVVKNGQVSPDLAKKVLYQFDKSITDALAKTKVKYTVKARNLLLLLLLLRFHSRH